MNDHDPYMTPEEAEEFVSWRNWALALQRADRAKYGNHGIHMPEPVNTEDDDDER